jgi:hypothetical protein
MTRRERTFYDAKPCKPMRYGLIARVADWRSGRSDGEHGIPTQPTAPPEQSPALLTTAYLDALNHRYQDSAQAENLSAVRDVADALVRRRILQRDIAEREDRSQTLRKQLDAMPEMPDDSVLSERLATEQHADPLLVRSRRLRDHRAARLRLQASMDRADEEVRALQVELAEAVETIAVRKRVLAIRVTRLGAYAMRRRSHYLRYLADRHPNGPVLVSYFDLSSPRLPDWLENWPESEGAAEI